NSRRIIVFLIDLAEELLPFKDINKKILLRIVTGFFYINNRINGY
ncbi:MAG: hypothetical protein RL034_947, partial [Bacteroidota bacterium]